MPIHIKGSGGAAMHERYYARLSATSDTGQAYFDRNTQILTIKMPDGKVAAYDSPILSGLSLVLSGAATGKGAYEHYGSGDYLVGLIPSDGVSYPNRLNGSYQLNVPDELSGGEHFDAVISSDKKTITLNMKNNTLDYWITAANVSILVE